MTRERIVCAMSGGVDSSVAAALLVEQGYDVVGVFLRLGHRSAPRGLETPPVGDRPPTGDRPARRQGCCSVADAGDARRTAEGLGIPFYAVDAADGFRRIVDDFVDGYAAGETPNPCVRCNGWLKFGHLLDLARSLGAARVATGHYARAVRERGRTRLYRGRDQSKDQSYVLFPIGPERMDSVCFPLGDLDKGATRELARERGLAVADKAESQEICFVPGDYREVVSRLRPDTERPGPIVDSAGRNLGSHRGVAFYTVGQRKGLGVGGMGIAAGSPLYVLERDAATNTLVVGGAHELGRTEFRVRDMVWLGCEPPEAGVDLRALAQIRYRHRPVPCTLRAVEGGTVQNRVTASGAEKEWQVVLDRPERGVAPGQAAVLYRDDEVLAGGWIS